MANEVYANGREVSCKAADGKSICAFPDVCFTPPQTPATPPGVPIPYPNTGMASDTTDGSKTVKVSGKEVMLKNKSYFKKSTGDEAGSAPKKGILTSVNRGKVYFQAWSMDVKFEGENVVRHFDLTTHNHNPSVGQTPPWPYSDRMAMATGLSNCDNDVQKAKDACNPWDEKTKCPDSSALDNAKKNTVAVRKSAGKSTPAYKAALLAEKRAYADYAKKLNQNDCHRALKCILAPYEPSQCCKPQTPHHLVDVSSFTEDRKAKKRIAGCKKYDDSAAPCVCAEGNDNSTGNHGLLHLRQREYGEKWAKANPGRPWTLPEASKCGADAMTKVFPNSNCNPKCIEDQLNREHQNMKVSDSTPLRRRPSGARDQSAFNQEWTDFNTQLASDIASKSSAPAAALC